MVRLWALILEIRKDFDSWGTALILHIVPGAGEILMDNSVSARLALKITMNMKSFESQKH